MTTTHLQPYRGPVDESAADPDELDARAIAQEHITGPILSARYPIFEWASDNPIARQMALVLKEYREVEHPRDSGGRWTSEGASVAGGEDMMPAARAVVALLRERFLATHAAGEYRWPLNEYQKGWLGESDWMTSEMADEAVAKNLVGTPNYTGLNDPTPERVAAVSEVVDSLKDIPGLPRDRFPLPVFVTVGGSGHNGAQDKMGNAAETLNENIAVVYDNGTDQMYPEEPFDPQQAVTHNLQDVLIHEYGHAIQDTFGRRGEWDRMWADYSVSDEYVPDGALFKRPEGGLSFYAGTNAQEGFAEAFLTAVRISDGQYATLRPEAKKLVDFIRSEVMS